MGFRSLQPFSQDYNMASHITCVVSVNFIHERWDLQLKVDSKRQIFWETFPGHFYLNSRSFCQKHTEKKSPNKYFQILCFDVFNKPGRCQLDNDDFTGRCIIEFNRNINTSILVPECWNFLWGPLNLLDQPNYWQIPYECHHQVHPL